MCKLLQIMPSEEIIMHISFSSLFLLFISLQFLFYSYLYIIYLYIISYKSI